MNSSTSQCEEDRVVIIAEAGVNHNGSLERAFDLIKAAAEAGVDYIKFQTFKAENLVTAEAPLADYAKRNLVNEGGQLEMLAGLELNDEDHRRLIDRCESSNIKFLSTGFDELSLEMLVSLGIDRIKIPSGEVTNLPYLWKAATFGLPIILSTGMTTMKEVEKSVKALVSAGQNPSRMTLLHCTTEYPTPYKEVNLRAMLSMGKKLDLPVGYSDHTMGIEVPVAAVALGAKIIEKHFTLDRGLEGPDHKASLEPRELKKMVESIRRVESAMGDGIKVPQPRELKNIPVARKSIHLKENVDAGTILENNQLTMLRPGDGISPMDLGQVLGRRVSRFLVKHHKLAWTDLE